MATARAKFIEWETLEHPFYEKKADWYWIVGIIGGLVAFLAFIFGNVLFALILVILTVVIIVHGAKVPGTMRVRLGVNDIRVGNVVYQYPELKSFSIEEEGDEPMLTLVANGILDSHVRIGMEEVEVEAVRAYLIEHLDESYHEDTLTEAAMDYLGF